MTPNYLSEYITFAVITRLEPKEHEVRTRTPGQRRKLIQRIVEASKNKVPTSMKSLAGSPNRAEYEAAITKEMGAMEERSVFELFDRIDIPEGAEIGRLALILSRKRDGSFKARLIFNGAKQRFKITDSYSAPTLSPTSLRLALAVSAERGYSFRTADVQTAFLYATLPPNTILYAELTDGYPNADALRATKVIKINKALYGLRESPMLWFKHLQHYLRQTMQLKQSIYDECFLSNADHSFLLLVYVDDLLMLGSPQQIHSATTMLKKKFKITCSDINNTVDFLGCNISRNSAGDYQLSQATYLNSILAKYATHVPVKHTPLPVTNHSTETTTSDINKTYQYRQITGSLGYLRLTRFDILQPLNIVARTGTYPTTYHIQQLEHLLGYLKYTTNQSMIFYGGKSNTEVLAALSDAEWAGNTETRRSLGGSFIYHDKSCIAASCKTQNVVATSAGSAELIEIYRTVKQLIYIAGQLKEVGVKELTTVLLTDSQSSVDATKRAVSEKSKHMAIYIHFVKEQLGRNFIVKHISRDKNFADMLTKQSPQATFEQHWQAASSPFRWVHKLV